MGPNATKNLLCTLTCKSNQILSETNPIYSMLYPTNVSYTFLLWEKPHLKALFQVFLSTATNSQSFKVLMHGFVYHSENSYQSRPVNFLSNFKLSLIKRTPEADDSKKQHNLPPNRRSSSWLHTQTASARDFGTKQIYVLF